MVKKKISIREIASVLDHSVLKPDMTIDDIRSGCRVAKKFGTATVCARPSDLPVICGELKGTTVKPTTVIGFPHGTCTTETKVFEIRDAVKKGALECDAVMNVGRFLSGEYNYVEEELKQMAAAAHDEGAMLKVIFENHYLNAELIAKACELASIAGCDFIKTSTGYAGSGARLEDLRIMIQHANGMKVKAAGGIRTLDAVLSMMSIGVSRCGTSSSEAILQEAQERSERDELYIMEENY